jgi:Ribbon-helix-helix domain
MPNTQTSENARWNLVVSKETDISLRQFLANQGGFHKGDLSRFVEESVKFHMFNLAAEEAKANNRNYSQTEIDNAIDEALNWANQ